MATTREARFCPKCGGEITGITGTSCPVCGGIIKSAVNTFFGTPDYLWHQREALLDTVDPSRPTAKTKAPDPKKQEEINTAFTQWLRSSSYEDKLAAMRDAQLTLQHLIYCPISAPEMRNITTVAKSIGKLAESYEHMFRNGGVLYDGKVGHVPAFRDGADGDNETIG